MGNRLLIGIPRERNEEERRLPLTPEAVDMLTDCGHRVVVETNAGLGINYSDNHFSEAGAEIVSTPQEIYQADLTYSSVGKEDVQFTAHYPALTLLGAFDPLYPMSIVASLHLDAFLEMEKTQ